MKIFSEDGQYPFVTNKCKHSDINGISMGYTTGMVGYTSGISHLCTWDIHITAPNDVALVYTSYIRGRRKWDVNRIY